MVKIRFIKFIKTLVLVMCIALLLSGIAYADTGGGVSSAYGGDKEILMDMGDGSPDTLMTRPAPDQPTSINTEILEKQIELDRYLFGKGAQELAERGFTVTHTVPLDTHVEIGINPYNEENAEFLYEILGRDKIKIVEGTQAIALDIAVQSSGEAEVAAANDATEENFDMNLPLFSVIGIALLVSFGAFRKKLK